jgi:hypothetical protein
VRRRYAKDDWSPDPQRRKKGQPASSVLGDLKPSLAAKKLAAKVWAKQGYIGE